MIIFLINRNTLQYLGRGSLYYANDFILFYNNFLYYFCGYLEVCLFY